jgi:hypothetical protein
MLGQAIPFGISVNSPLTLFVIVVALIVVLLTLSARRANTRPRPRPGLAPPPPEPPEPVVPPDPTANAWAAAQALFFDDPRAGCASAEALVASILQAGDLTLDAARLAARRFGDARAVLARSDASTDDLRWAFVEFRALYEAHAMDESSAPEP